MLAARPKTLAAAIAPVLVGTGLAYANGVFAAGPALAALLGATLIQIGTNFANDYHDFLKGADTDTRLGPPRATQEGLLEPTAVRRGAALTFALAVLVGAWLVWVAGWPILLIGLASIASGIAYTAGPTPLAYVGLGDLFVLIFFGPVAVGGTYFVQALRLDSGAITAGVAMGALCTMILVANNLRDIETDAEAGKRTLAVRLGRTGTRVEYVLLLLVAFLVPPYGILVDDWPLATLAVLAALPVALPPLRAVLRHRHPRELRPALAGTARLVAVYGVLLSIGFVIG